MKKEATENGRKTENREEIEEDKRTYKEGKRNEKRIYNRA